MAKHKMTDFYATFITSRVFAGGVRWRRNVRTRGITNGKVNERKEGASQSVSSVVELRFRLHVVRTLNFCPRAESTLQHYFGACSAPVCAGRRPVQPAVNYAALIFTQRLCLICLCFFSSHRGRWDGTEKSFLPR